MRLDLVGKLVWEVLAITDAVGWNVLKELAAIDPGYRHAEVMRVLIETKVPRDGPPVYNKNRCSPLGENIFEFKTGPEKGKKLRVLWFYDAGEPTTRNRIICTHSFLKATQRTPPGEKARAVRIRKEYLEAKRAGKLILPPKEK